MSAKIINKSDLTKIMLLLFFGLAGVCLLSLSLGPAGFDAGQNSSAILTFRMSRILLALIAGSSLAASGASLQAIFRNPLADPHLFGISGGAALGAAVVIALGNRTSVLPSLGAIVGGLLAFSLLYFFIERAGEAFLGNYLLLGVLINALASGLITLFKTMLPPGKTQSLLFWLIGQIGVVDKAHFWLIIPLWLGGLVSLWLIKGQLEVLSFGVLESQILGLNSRRIIKIAMIANCVLIGNVVAFSGMIGFLGLVIPQFVRLIFYADTRVVLPIATIAGALVLVFFDSLSRLSFAFFQTEIPVGALTALILSPAFFFLLLRERSHG